MRARKKQTIKSRLYLANTLAVVLIAKHAVHNRESSLLTSAAQIAADAPSHVQASFRRQLAVLRKGRW